MSASLAVVGGPYKDYRVDSVVVYADGSDLAAGSVAKVVDKLPGYVSAQPGDSSAAGADTGDYVYVFDAIKAGRTGRGVERGYIVGVDTSTWTAPYVWLTTTGTLANVPTGGLVKLGKVTKVAADGVIEFDGNPPRLKDTIHPKFWGAACDGTTQDRVAWKAMNAWLDANNGGTICLEREDVINLDGDIYVGRFPGPNYGSNVTVVGNGATLLRTFYYNGTDITDISGGTVQKRAFLEFGAPSSPYGSTPTARNIRISGLKCIYRFTSVNGNWYSYLQGLGANTVIDYISCLTFIKCDNVAIEDCDFRFEAPDLVSRWTQQAVIAYGLSNAIMKNCRQYQTQAKLGAESSGYGYRNITYRDNYAEYPCNGQFSCVGGDPGDDFEDITVVDNHQYGMTGEFQVFLGSDGGAGEIGKIRNITVRGNTLDGPWIVRNPDVSIPNPGIIWTRYQVSIFCGPDSKNIVVSGNRCNKESEESTAGLTTSGEGQVYISRMNTPGNPVASLIGLVVSDNTLSAGSGVNFNGWQLQLFGTGSRVSISGNVASAGRGYRWGADGGSWSDVVWTGNVCKSTEKVLRLTVTDADGEGVRGSFLRCSITGNSWEPADSQGVIWFETLTSSDVAEFSLAWNRFITTGISFLRRLFEITGNVLPAGVYARNNSMDGEPGYNDAVPVAVSADRDLTSQDGGKVFHVDATAGDVLVRLQDNVGGNIGCLFNGLRVSVRKIAGANNVIVRGGQSTIRQIDGSTDDYVIYSTNALTTFVYYKSTDSWRTES